MADADSLVPPHIAALPATTVRQLGSSNVLRDPSSVVKELIDNALDARTNAIFVDISGNILDSIQVKDTGHGISAEDRPLVCRRYCTSKIRDFQDLEEIGGKWLGFRGEALASMAEMSGTLEVTTRSEGEPVAVKLRYGRDGELISTEHASAPVGSTVKVTNFFQTLPVRKQTALKESSKTLAKIKHLMQAYALARPSTRFSLRVLKVKSNKSDFMYAPKKDANIEDAVLKIIGSQCTVHCDWTVMESEGFEIRAFLPKPDAIGSKIGNAGAFLSVDGRPISTIRGTPKKIFASFKERLRKANPGFRAVKDPFFCMNIKCPPGSYDPNIEPAKDDVLFEREDIVLGAVTRLFMAYYPEAALVNNTDTGPGLPANICTRTEEVPTRPETTYSILEEAPTKCSNRPETAFSILEEVLPSEAHNIEAPYLWRSNMYGIDEEDLELLDSASQPPVIEEEEEGRRAVDASNPWIIARMNASIRPKQPTNNGQLMTPAKNYTDITVDSSSPTMSGISRQRLPLEPPTPQTISRTNISSTSIDSTLRESIEHPSHILDSGYQASDLGGDMGRVQTSRNIRPAIRIDTVYSSSPVPRRTGRKQPRGDQQSLHAFEGRPDGNAWFGKPMRGQVPFKPPRSKKSKRNQDLDISMFDNDTVPRGFTSKNNTDIRNFLGRAKGNLQQNTPGSTQDLSAVEPRIMARFLRSSGGADSQVNSRVESIQSANPTYESRALPVKPLSESRRVRNLPQYASNAAESLDFRDQLRTYAEREAPQHPRARASSLDSTAVFAPSDGALQRPDYPDKTRLQTGRSRTTDLEMNTMFAAYSDAPNAPTNHPPPVKPPRVQPAHETVAKSVPKRRRTTEGVQRTKSSRLPLEQIPQGYRLQNLFLLITLDLSQITRSMRKLNMRCNSPKWTSVAESSSSDALNMKMTDDTLQSWVVRLDGMLDHFNSQLDRDAAHTTLERSIVKAFHERQIDDDVETNAMLCMSDEIVQPGLEDCMNGLDQLREWAREASPSKDVVQHNSSTTALPQMTNPVVLAGENEIVDEFGGEDFDDEKMLIDF